MSDQNNLEKIHSKFSFPSKIYTIFTIIVFFGFFVSDTTVQELNKYCNSFGKFSHEHVSSITNILTVDSIITGSMFTFIVVSIDRGSDPITRIKNKMYWSNAMLFTAKTKRKRMKWFFNLSGFFSFKQITPLSSVVISIMCTSGEGLSMYLGTTIFAIVCLIITTILMISSVFRVIHFSNEWIYSYAKYDFDEKYEDNFNMKHEFIGFKSIIMTALAKISEKNEKRDMELDHIYKLLNMAYYKVNDKYVYEIKAHENEKPGINTQMINDNINIIGSVKNKGGENAISELEG